MTRCVGCYRLLDLIFEDFTLQLFLADTRSANIFELATAITFCMRCFSSSQNLVYLLRVFYIFLTLAKNS